MHPKGRTADDFDIHSSNPSDFRSEYKRREKQARVLKEREQKKVKPLPAAVVAH